MKNIRFYNEDASYQSDKQHFSSLGGGAVVAYANDTDKTYYYKPLIIGTTLSSFTATLGGDSYTFTSPNFRVRYSGDTLASLSNAFANFDINLPYSSNIYSHTMSHNPIISIDKWTIDTSNVNNFASCFEYCNHLSSLDLSSFNTSKATSMDSIFCYCRSLSNIDVSSFDTSNVTNMNSMFSCCNSVKRLNVSSFDTSKVTDMSWMFEWCNSLISLDLSNFNTSKVTNMSGMLHGLYSLNSLDLSNFDTSKVTNMYFMFDESSSLTSLNISSFNLSAVTNVRQMFTSCSSLTDLQFGTNLKVSLDLSDSPLTHTSALSVLNGLATITDAQTITFKATTYSTLTAAEIKAATDKGWTVVSA